MSAFEAIKAAYAAFGRNDPSVLFGAMDPAINWNEAEGRYDGAGEGRILIGFTPAGRMEQFFRDLEKRGEYFGNGTADDKETARLLGIVNVGPPLKL